MSRLMLPALLCAAIVLPASETARAAPCGVTAATILDSSPYKVKPPGGDPLVDRAARRGATKNVGQEVRLSAGQTGTPAGRASYRWFVEGEVIDDYVESPAEQPEGTPRPFRLTDHPEVTEGSSTGAVFTNREITFYWRMQGIDLSAPVNVTVTLAISESGADRTPCATTSAGYTIERSRDNSENQPEDYYVEINHGRRVVDEHAAWHGSHQRGSGVYHHGAMFADFHHIFLANYAAFRATFGYPAVGFYIPNLALPTTETGYTMDHARRFGGVGTKIRPLWTTRVGGGNADRRVKGGINCPSDPGGQRSAGDFNGDLSLFGCAVENEWHNPIHGNIGGASGDMSSSLTAPQDPIFWRWHSFVDNVFEGFRALSSRVGHGHARVAQAARTTCQGLRATIVGTAGRDVLRGTPRRDVIVARGGNDVVRGLGGDDVLCGGPGRDRLSGGKGFDVADAGAGGDRVDGGAGDDQLGGAAGRDRVRGGAGSDQLYGGPGDDVLDGGAGSEWVIQGDGGDDRLAGGSGTDQLYGGGGRDRLAGGAHDDVLDGGAGDDALDGGAGDDATVYFASPRGVDVNLGTGRAGGYGDDRLDDVERVDGSRFADELTGGRGDEFLNGHDGGDELSSGGGEDVVIGGDGSDDAAAGGGADICLGEEEDSGCED
jgi:Ca2+-binding RTX toxin-like protein